MQSALHLAGFDGHEFRLCLSGEDDKFDLQSLVGVIEKREPGYWDGEY